MKKNSSPQSAFFNIRSLIGLTLCLFGLALSLLVAGALPGTSSNASGKQQARPGSQRPDVLRMVGPALQNKDLRQLPYIPANAEHEERRLSRHPRNPYAFQGISDPLLPVTTSAPSPDIPSPLLTFAGMGPLPEDAGVVCPRTVMAMSDPTITSSRSTPPSESTTRAEMSWPVRSLITHFSLH